VGSLKGKLIVQWWEPDKFVFLPNKGDPLTFKRSDGETITRCRMFTDSGSIRRPVCTKNLIRVDAVMESPKLAE
jgi:hypothetical protein